MNSKLLRQPIVMAVLIGFVISASWVVVAGLMTLGVLGAAGVGNSLLETPVPSWIVGSLGVAFVVLVASRWRPGLPVAAVVGVVVTVAVPATIGDYHPDFRQFMVIGATLAALTAAWAIAFAVTVHRSRPDRTGI